MRDISLISSRAGRDERTGVIHLETGLASGHGAGAAAS
jgi:hypothetical protein